MFVMLVQLPNTIFDGNTFAACISDADCDQMDDYHILNHFDNSGDFSGEEMILVVLFISCDEHKCT